jgi:ribose transport system permease protein
MIENSSQAPATSTSLGGRLRAFVLEWTGGRGRESLRRRWVDYGFALVFLILLLLAASASDVFLTQNNISNLIRQIVTNGLISLGMLVVILTGGIDLSVGCVVALTGIMVAGYEQWMPLPLAILISLIVGILCGAFNGFVIARFKLQPFIVTLATMGAIRGMVYVYSETPITPSNQTFIAILGSATIGPIPVAGLIMLVCFVLVWIFLNRTTAGRAIVAIGGNAEAVRLAGININAHLVLAYAISGLFATIAGVILAARVGIVQPSVGAGFELDAIAACVIGGAMLGGGGGGGAVGTFGGVLALGLINNLLNLFDVQSYYQQIFKGLIILFAVLARRREQ